MYGKLTAKQRLFIDNYLISLNATESAKLAGYSPRTAHAIGVENLKKPLIKKSIEEAMQARSEELKRTATDVLRDIVEIGRAARQKDNFTASLKALELEGKHYGMFKPDDTQTTEETFKKLDAVLEQFGGVI